MQTVIILLSLLPAVSVAGTGIGHGSLYSNRVPGMQWPPTGAKTNQPSPAHNNIRAGYVKCHDYRVTNIPGSTPSSCIGGCRLVVYTDRDEFYSECPNPTLIPDDVPVCVSNVGRAVHELDFICYCTTDMCNSIEEMRHFYPNETIEVSFSPSVSVYATLICLIACMF